MEIFLNLRRTPAIAYLTFAADANLLASFPHVLLTLRKLIDLFKSSSPASSVHIALVLLTQAMHFNFISLVLGLFAVVYAAPLDVNHNKDIGSQLSSRNQPFDPNGKVIVAFNQNSGNNSQGLAPPHHPPVPQQVETRVADYFRETFSDMQCDIRYEAGTVYMLENELAIFQIRWRWDNSMYWQGVEIGGATKKELQPQQADLPDKIGGKLVKIYKRNGLLP
ncbi:hypothetical protein F5876DRAFT_83999 [Lentinula aff. lateritia]|uniref:Uncharacterized protein n=1 Tax=Lentinula aff. lateritia TaxID=2804960 RepID=A0ACC1TGT8_9AGAR|nr:hypothetical protein F5876DRAFT_83999 [Lentinula aff. lateritia]